MIWKSYRTISIWLELCTFVTTIDSIWLANSVAAFSYREILWVSWVQIHTKTCNLIWAYRHHHHHLCHHQLVHDCIRSLHHTYENNNMNISAEQSQLIYTYIFIFIFICIYRSKLVVASKGISMLMNTYTLIQ